MLCLIRAQARGGALYADAIPLLFLTSVSFDGNLVVAISAGNTAQGSAIYAGQVDRSLLTDCTFRNHNVAAGSVIQAQNALSWHCPLGKWAPLTGAIPRPGQQGADFTGCPYSCPLGTIGDRPNITSSEDCQSCPRGHYCSERGLAVPYPCPAGKRMPSLGARSAEDCLPCGLGQFSSEAAQAQCSICPPGTFAEEDGSVGCSSCPSGGWCPDAGGTNRLVLRKCPAGTYNPDEGASSNASCRACPPGRSSPIPGLSNASACVACLPGSAAPTSGTAVCSPCSQGRYADKKGATQCALCRRGYCPSGASRPLPCPGGTIGNAADLSSEANCTPVMPGFWAPIGSAAPDNCPSPGFFCPGASRDSTYKGARPIPVARGHRLVYTKRGLPVNQAPCPSGSWCTAGKLVPCVAKTYSSAVNASTEDVCVPCPPNSFTEGGNASSLAQCKCDAGFYLYDVSDNRTVDNDRFCRPCGFGMRCTTPGLTLHSLPLEVGFWRIGANSTDVRRCPDASSNSSGCGGSEGGGCKPWLTGIYCKLCNASARGVRYYDAQTSSCQPCKNAGKSMVPALGVVAGTLGAVLLALLVLHCRRGLGWLQHLHTSLTQRFVVRLSLQPKIKCVAVRART